MNESERQLIDLMLEGSLPEQECAHILSRLEGDPEALAYLADRTLLVCALRKYAGRAALRDWATASLAGTSPKAVKPLSRWTWVHPLAAMAASLAVGLFSASLVFGFVREKTVGERTPYPLTDASFENPELRLTKGFAGGLNQWCGVDSHVVMEENGHLPKDGKYMLRLDSKARWPRRVSQAIDLGSLRTNADGATREIEVSAFFLAGDKSVPVRYAIQAFAIGENLADFNDDWNSLREAAIVTGARGVDVKQGASGWQKVALTIQVPSSARTLIISFIARHQDKATIASQDYLDAIALTTRTIPSP